MRKFAVLDGAGLLVVSVLASPAPPDHPAGVIEVPREFDLARVLASYVEGGVLRPRPRLSPPEWIAGGCVLRDVPPGARVVLREAELGEVLADLVTDADVAALEFGLGDPGLYQFEILPPAPYLAAVFEWKVPA